MQVPRTPNGGCETRLKRNSPVTGLRNWTLGGLTGLILAAACGPATPVIDIETTAIDLGEISQRPVETTVGVSNVGHATLHILAIPTSCGCTRAWVADSVLVPGDSTILTIRYDPTAMSPADTGPIHRGVYVRSDDPKRLEVEIHLNAVVLPSGGL